MLKFQTVNNFRKGSLSDLLHKSYSSLITDPGWDHEAVMWDKFDDNAFKYPMIGKCTFVTTLQDKPIGLASYDPRQWPEVGIIGQNCILPQYQGSGYGKMQISEILRIFKENDVKMAKVTTSEHPFFAPALKMYKDLGFIETVRMVGGPDPRYKIIELGLAL